MPCRRSDCCMAMHAPAAVVSTHHAGLEGGTHGHRTHHGHLRIVVARSQRPASCANSPHEKLLILSSRRSRLRQPWVPHPMLLGCTAVLRIGFPPYRRLGRLPATLPPGHRGPVFTPHFSLSGAILLPAALTAAPSMRLTSTCRRGADMRRRGTMRGPHAPGQESRATSPSPSTLWLSPSRASQARRPMARAAHAQREAGRSPTGQCGRHGRCGQPRKWPGAFRRGRTRELLTAP